MAAEDAAGGGREPGDGEDLDHLKLEDRKQTVLCELQTADLLKVCHRLILMEFIGILGNKGANIS